MALYSNISDFKKYVGGGANMSLKMESIEPIMYDVVRDHLAPYLGYAYISKIVAADTSLAAADDAAFWDKVKRAIAQLTLFEYSKIGAVQLSELGIMRATTETHTTAFQYQETEYRNAMLTKGYEALEELLVYLEKEANNTKYNWWLDGEGSKRHTELMVRTAATMRTIYGMDITRYSYEILRGLLKEVEYYLIEAKLPAKFYTHLKGLVGKTSATPAEAQLIGLIQSSIVHYVIQEGMQRFWVKIDGRSVVHIERKGNQSNATTTTGSPAAVKLKANHHETWAVRHVARMRSYIFDNKTAFPKCFKTTDGGENTDVDAWVTPVEVVETKPITKTIFNF